MNQCFFRTSLKAVACGLLGLSMSVPAAPVVETDSIIFPGAPLSKTVSYAKLKSAALDLVPLSIELSEPDESELNSMNTAQGIGKPVQVGFGRTLPAPYDRVLDLNQLAWTELPTGGQLALLSVRSPGAAAIRLLLDLISLPEGVELRFFKPEDHSNISEPWTHVDAVQAAQGFVPDDASGLRVSAPRWSPVIEGDSIGLEIFLPTGMVPQDVQLQLPLVSHLVASAYQPAWKSLPKIGESGSCQVDAACDTNGIPNALIDSVARIRFSDLTGFTGLCTGTLLNDTDDNTLIPYFYTANHCVKDQFTATSLELFWFFQRASCGGPDPTSVILQSSGAKLLANNRELDFALLQLNNDPPSGVGLSGWTTAPLHEAPGAVGIHHPSGDLKKISRGNGEGVAVVPDFFGSNNPDFIRVRWFSGTTEGGSSGSGLWADSNGQLRLIGTLTGGLSFCDKPSEPDFYGRFDLAFPVLEAFLSPQKQGSESARLLNISTNLHVDQEGAIAGFIVTGSEPQRFVVMGEDAGSLTNPVLSLRNFTTGELIASNDNWQTHATAAEVAASLREPATALSAAFAVSLPPGAYTATLSGAQGQTGQGIVSVTQTDGGEQTHLLNISTNGFANQQGAIAGFIVTGEGEKRFVIMAENAGSLSDPILTVTNLQRTQTFGSNDNWRDHATASEVAAKLREPAGEQDAALAVSLPQGLYLAIMQGKNGATGRGIVSVTEVSD